MKNEKKNAVLNTLYDAIEQVNSVLSKKMQLEKSPNTVIIGDSGQLDSLGFINFVTAVESKVKESFDISLDLINQDILLQNSLLTIDSLTEHIFSRLKEGGNNGL